MVKRIGIRGLDRCFLGALLLGLGPAAAFGPGCLTEPARVKVGREANALETDPLLDPERVLAEVNGKPITRIEYYRRILKKFGTLTMLSGMIKEDLFVQEAQKRGIEVKPEEVDAKVNDLLAMEASDAGGEAKLAEIYRAQGLELSDVRRDYAQDVKMHLLIGKVTKAFRSLDEETLRKYYKETYAKTRFRVRHIPYSYPLQGYPEAELQRRKVQAREKAERTVKRIREGADFAQIARQESEDMTRQSGGDLGYISEDQEMDPVMKDWILKLKPMEVSEPVENNLLGAYHVVQVTEIVPHKSFGECEEAMKKEILQKDPDPPEIQDALARLRAQSTVKVFGYEVDSPKVEAGVPASKEPKK